MSEYDNNMRGVLFRADKQESERSPAYKGTAEVDGTEYWLSAWIKTSKDGNKFMSLSFQAKDAKPASKAHPPKGGESKFKYDDPIPF